MTKSNEPQNSINNARNINLNRHAMDGDYPETTKPRCGMILLKYLRTHSFRCSNCNRDKVSRKIAISQKDPKQLICNACYGSIIAKNER